MELIHLAFYLGLIIFLVIVFAKAIKIATAPVHLRWELYPVAHEKGKAHYGGSYLEEFEWWTKPLQKNLLGEVWTMFQEIVFLKGVWEHNRSLWFGSAPFHYALYLYVVFTILTLLSLIFGLTPTIEGFSNHSIIKFLNVLLWISSIFGIIGAIVLFLKRIFDSNLKLYSNASHYFNILLIGALYVTSFIWLLSSENTIQEIFGFYLGVFSFSQIPSLPIVGYIHFYLLSFFLFYLPFTHMTHFFMKYFTYHKVRWDDEPNLPGSKFRKKLMEQLNFPVQWSAPHIGADGTKTWLIIASSPLPTKEKKNG
ncbi:MAG: respiratory nitrate reductase subunit gamma [Ignavibacteria bacterium]|nr:respiratory nitrate reductase subunit gamma [Ignavibacteria bacterium]